MLFYRSHWHFAREQDPSRESRVVGFASGANRPDPLANAEAFAAAGLTPEGQPIRRAPGDVADATRSAVADVLSGEQGSAEQAEGGGEYLRAAKIQTQYTEFLTGLGEALLKFDDKKMKEILPDATWRQQWAWQRSFVESTMREVQDVLAQEIAPLVAWEQGNMSPTAFREWISAEEPPPKPLSRRQKRAAYRASYKATADHIDHRIAEAREQLQSGAASPAETEVLTERIAEWEQEKSRVEERMNEAIAKLGLEGQEEEFQSQNERRKQFLQEQKHYKDALTAMIRTSRGHPVEEFDLHAGTLPPEYLPDLRDAHWKTYNDYTRRGIVQRMNDHPAMGGLVQTKLLMLQDTLEHMKEKLEASGMEDMLTKVSQAYEKEGKGMEATGADGKGRSFLAHWKAGWRSVGVNFYSIRGLMEGGKLWWEAWQGALSKYHHREGSLIASYLGKLTKVIPFGDEVEVELGANLDKSDDEVKDNYIDILKRRNVNFTELVLMPHCELSRNLADKNRTRAVLEYAAGRGWLYDLLNERKINGAQSFFGHSINNLVPEDWDEARVKDYVSKLTTEQSSGQDAEQEKYYKRYYHVHKTADFEKLLEQELNSYNMFGALGVLKRSIERGLTGYVTNWHAIRMMRKIQSDAIFRKYLTDTFLDKFGSMSLYNTHGRFSGSATKLHRTQILDEVRASENQGRAFNLARAIESGVESDSIKLYLDVQQYLEQSLYGGRNYDSMSADEQKEFDERFAQFTSGAIVEKDKKAITIFQDRFDYWTAVAVGQGQVNIKEEDEDYYRAPTWGAGQGSVTALLADETIVKQILSKTGDGQFTHETRSRFMADSIITHIENLRKKGLHADCEHFIQLMRDKINPLYLSYVSDNRAPGLSDQKLLRQHINPSERTPYVLLEFLRLGLIDVKSLFSTVTQTGGKLSLNLMGQAIAFESKMRKFAPEAMDAIHAEYARLKGENKKIVDDKVLTEQQGTVSSQPPATEPSAEDAFQLAA